MCAQVCACTQLPALLAHGAVPVTTTVAVRTFPSPRGPCKLLLCGLEPVPRFPLSRTPGHHHSLSFRDVIEMESYQCNLWGLALVLSANPGAPHPDASLCTPWPDRWWRICSADPFRGIDSFSCGAGLSCPIPGATARKQSPSLHPTRLDLHFTRGRAGRWAHICCPGLQGEVGGASSGGYHPRRAWAVSASQGL